MMKKIFLLAFSLTLFCDLWSQTFPDVKSVSDFVNDSIKRRADKINAGTLNKAYQGTLSFVPDIVQDTASITLPRHGMLRFQRKDSTGYTYDTIGYKRWRKYVPGTGGGGYSDEQAQDAVGAMASNEFTYVDASNSFSINSINAAKISGNKTSTFISDFNTAVQAIGDPRYALFSHNHVAANITDFNSAARGLLSGVNGVLYNNSTGVIAADTFLLATKPGMKKSLDSIRLSTATLYNSDGAVAGNRNVELQGNQLNFNNAGVFSVVGSASSGQWSTFSLGSTVAQLNFNQLGGAGVVRISQGATGKAPYTQSLSLASAGQTSEVRTYSDSVLFMPWLGQMNIDSLKRSADSTAFKPMGWNSVTGQWVALTYWPGSGTGGSAAADTLYAANGTQYLAGSGSNPDTVVLGGTFIRNTKISGVNLYGFKLDSLAYYALRTKDSVSWDVPKFAIRGLAKSVDTTTYKVQVIDPVTGDVRYAPWLAAGTGSYTFAQSLVNTSGTVALSGDLTTPGNNMLYGTNGTGVKGWYSQPAGASLTLQQVTDNGATTNHNITLGATTNNTAALVVNSYNKGILMHSITGGFDLNIDPSSIGAGAQGFNLYAISGDVGMESVGTGKRVILKANSVSTVVLDRSAAWQTDVTGTFRASGATSLTNYAGTGNALASFDNTGLVVRSSIDPANVVQTSGSYADPAWITSLAASKVLPSMASNSGKLLTTNGTAASWTDISGGYIQNQNASDQVASARVTGTMSAGNGFMTAALQFTQTGFYGTFTNGNTTAGGYKFIANSGTDLLLQLEYDKTITAPGLSGTGNRLLSVDATGKLVRSTLDPATVGSGGFSNPMTTLGDIIYGGSAGAATRLAGNTTTTKKILFQTGDGTNSAAPGWGTLAAGDVPALSTSNYTDASVTYAKIQNVTAGRLVGRYSASTGVAQEVSIGTGLNLDNSTGVLTSTAPTLTYGTYTPTYTAVQLVSGSSAFTATYTRVGNIVTVSGRVDITNSSTGTVVLRMSLPIASNFTTADQGSGNITSDTNVDNGAIYTDATNDAANISIQMASTGQRHCYFTFTYQVL